jgi:pimeloyl-ACP methyl ester carboxylesterase
MAGPWPLVLGWLRQPADQPGPPVQAVQLRGHDRPPGRIWHRVRHYLDDVQRAAARFAEPPVLVGHSLGGLLAQRCLELHPALGRYCWPRSRRGACSCHRPASPPATLLGWLNMSAPCMGLAWGGTQRVL